jgi:hypothetical protein
MTNGLWATGGGDGGAGGSSAWTAFRLCLGARVKTNPSSSSIDDRFLPCCFCAIRSLDRRRLAGGESPSATRFLPFSVFALLCCCACRGGGGGGGGNGGGECRYSFVWASLRFPPTRTVVVVVVVALADFRFLIVITRRCLFSLTRSICRGEADGDGVDGRLAGPRSLPSN